MKSYFDIPSERYRGWPGDAEVCVDTRHCGYDAGKGRLRIMPCGSYGHDYLLELQPGQLIVLALQMWVAKARFWWVVRK